MNTEFGSKLQEAIEAKQNDINNLTWKDRSGNTVRLMDLTQDELQRCYRHADQMLNNVDIYKPGRRQVRKNINACWESCNAELFLRYLLRECNTSIKTNKDLLDFINQQRQERKVSLTDSISVLFDHLPSVYEKVTVNKLMDACFDKGEVINKKLITDKFIFNQGIWLTDEEKKDLTEFDSKGRMRNRMEVIKERLCLNPEIHLRISPSGLSFAEFRALVQMSSVLKISSLSTIALKTLRDKILLLLDNDLEYHIQKWIQIQQDIERVAEYKNWSLN